MPLETLIANGPVRNRIDVIVLGDGYRTPQFDTQRSHVEALGDYLFSTGGALSEPFGTYARFFNLHMITTASRQSGADDPNAGITVSTAFNASYNWDGETDRLLYIDDALADAAVRREIRGTKIEPEMLFLTVNSDKYGGGGGKYAVYAGGNGDSLEVALHEVGHSFANLADEYEGSPGRYTGGERPEPNVTTDSEAAKWAHWLGYEQPGIGTIGAYEGGYYHSEGVYRPSENSKMRALGEPFDIVSVEAFIRTFYEIVDPLDRWVFPRAEVVQGKAELWVKPIDARLIDVTWSVNGRDLGLGDVTRIDLTEIGLRPGREVTITAFAEDMTEWVRIGRGALQQEVEWQVVIPYYRNVETGTAQGDRLVGVAWDDVLSGRGGADVILGRKGADRLFGEAGRDTLRGDKGQDVIEGGRGGDTLDGGVGDDRLTGGGGADNFLFGAGGGHDRITDFDPGRDRLGLDPDLWSADLRPREVLARFADDMGDDVVLDFGRGHQVVLRGISNIDDLIGDVFIL